MCVCVCVYACNIPTRLKQPDPHSSCYIVPQIFKCRIRSRKYENHNDISNKYNLIHVYHIRELFISIWTELLLRVHRYKTHNAKS